MKNFLLIAISFISFQFVFGQKTLTTTTTDVVKSNEIKSLTSLTTKNSIYQDTISSKKNLFLWNYIAKNYQVPEVSGLKGKVVVSFVVDENGSIGDFKILENLGHGTAQELIRVLKTTDKKWKPRIIDGKAVKRSFYLPISIHSQ